MLFLALVALVFGKYDHEYSRLNALLDRIERALDQDYGQEMEDTQFTDMLPASLQDARGVTAGSSYRAKYSKYIPFTWYGGDVSMSFKANNRLSLRADNCTPSGIVGGCTDVNNACADAPYTMSGNKISIQGGCASLINGAGVTTEITYRG